MTRIGLNSMVVVILALFMPSPVSAQGSRDRDRDRDDTGEVEADRDRGDRDRDSLRRRSEPDGRRDFAPPNLRSRPRERDDQEGTEEGMPKAPLALPGQPGARLVPPEWRPQWKLGVFAANTDTGVRVTRVIPGTPAQQAGLERGDTIVTIDGYQIGYVNGRPYPLGEELQRRAGRTGRVSLLVHNWRNGQLLNREVQLDRQRW